MTRRAIQRCDDPNCDGKYVIKGGKDLGTMRVGYLSCDVCGEKPLVSIVYTPNDDVQRRKRKPRRPWWSYLIS